MESKFMKRHAHLVAITEKKIAKKQGLLKASVEVVREYANKDNSEYYIVNFVSPEIAKIEKLRNEIQQLEDQLSMLAWMTDEEDDS